MYKFSLLWLTTAAHAAILQEDTQAVLGGETVSTSAAPDDDSWSKVDTPKNVVFILTDDQDSVLDSMSYMPLVQKYLAEEGTTFANHFTTTAICCPSRVSLWTGKQPHNTNVTDVNPPYGNQMNACLPVSSLHKLIRKYRRIPKVCFPGTQQ